MPQEAKGSETIKRLLNNLATIAHGLAEIRNLYGTGHGKGGKTPAIKPRHAKLAVGAAITLATFLFETHQENKAA
ncbi:MAG: abortive infection family protein [bacterium]